MRKRADLFLVLFFSLLVLFFPHLDLLGSRLILIFFLFLLFLFVSYFWRKKLRFFLRALKELRLGNFKVRVFCEGRDELGELSREINELAGKLEYLSESLRAMKSEVEGIFDIVSDPLLLLDDVGRVVIANRAFAEIAGSEKLKDKWYWEAVREGEFFDLVERARENPKVDGMELSLSGKTFVASTVSLNGKVLIYLREITETVRLKEAESDLISNIAHELKTPLTAIKGALETMEEIGIEEGAEFLFMIKRHTERLISTVSDLLTLQRMERRTGLKFEKLNMAELVEEVLTLLEREMKLKGISLEINFPRDLPPVKGDRFALEHALINLIDNAVKYNVEGGKIRISATYDERCIKLSVEDTGVGIHPDHLPRIFDRFYVVDRSRSRKIGGTGLGLSIVKEVALLHGGEIKVESTPGEGSKFTLILPL